MGYLDSSTIFVDAILTKKGREKLAMGQSLDISKFALSDDEIDYSLYEPAHPKGSAFYDALIKAIPIMEASPDETQVLKYKLVTLPKGTTQIPVVSLGIASITTSNRTPGSIAITPSTSPTGNTSAGYTLVLADKNAGTISVTTAATGTPTFPYMGGDMGGTAQVVTGLTFSFRPNFSIRQTISTTLTVFGNETGGTTTIPVLVRHISLERPGSATTTGGGGGAAN